MNLMVLFRDYVNLLIVFIFLTLLLSKKLSYFIFMNSPKDDGCKLSYSHFIGRFNLPYYMNSLEFTELNFNKVVIDFINSIKGILL